MKANIITDEQLEFLSNDIADMVARLEDLKNEFDAKGIKDELVNEIKQAITDNTIFSKLSEESLELEANLRMLKRVGQSYQECAHEKLIKTVGIVLISAAVGAGISALCFKLFT